MRIIHEVEGYVILVVEGEEQSYGSGEELTALTFEKNYIVESISARESRVLITLKENERQFNIKWICEEEVNYI